MPTDGKQAKKRTRKPVEPITGLPGQCVLPELVDAMGYDTVCLDHKQERFCREYVIDDNGTQAYIRAYPDSSYESARVGASRLLTDVNIQARIAVLREQRNKRLEITADRVLDELAKMAFFNVADLFDVSGKLRAITDMDRDITAGIASVEVARMSDKTPLIKIKLHDKKGSLELLGKTAKLKLFSDTLNLNHQFKESTDEELLARSKQLAADIVAGRV